jgi:hypothetical protein
MNKKIEQVNFLVHIEKLNQYKKNNNNYLYEKIDHIHEEMFLVNV